MFDQSEANDVARPSGKEARDSWTFLIQMEIWDPLSIFSKYIPAKPEQKQAPIAAATPSSWFCSATAAAAEDAAQKILNLSIN